MGASAGWAHESGSRQRALHDRQLDQEIGVDGGDIGAVAGRGPEARIGAFSAATTGAAANETDPTPSDGPITPSE